MSDNSAMDQGAYIRQLEAENARLKQRVEFLEKRLQQMAERLEELERRLGMNSQNSSKPPSSDPPGLSLPPPRRRRGKRGARKGHPPRRIHAEGQFCFAMSLAARLRRNRPYCFVARA